MGQENKTCDYYYDYLSAPGQMFANIDWTNVQATDLSGIPHGITYLSRYSTYCCSDGKSAVWQDYSRSCKNSSAYNGAAITPQENKTCDYYYDYLSAPGQMFENISWANVQATDFTSITNGFLF